VKMKKKKKKKNVEDTLARAEKMFARGNFPLAQKEFEKAYKKLKRNDIAEKIAICRSKSEAIRAKELIKRARRAEKKGELNRALNCYKEAAPICGEEWIVARIGKLKECLIGRNAALEAGAAETVCDFQKAADLYARACEIGESGELLLKRAHCLVKAENYPEAVAVFKNLSITDPGSRYDYGLALSKTGRYSECLKIWEGLDAENEMVAEQKRTVCLGLAADLYDRFAEKRDYAAIYSDAQYLLHLPWLDFEPRQIRSLENLVEYCRYAWIEELWDKEEFTKVAELLKTVSHPMRSDLLPLTAKTWFKLAADDSRHLSAMLPFWLTAVYSCSIAPRENGADKVRQKLVDAAEDLIQKAADTRYGKQAAVYIELEKKSIRSIIDLMGEQEKSNQLLCTPLYAAHAGKSDQILSRVRKDKGFFKDNEHYLETGAYYSAAGKSLYLLKNNQFEEAVNLITDLQQKIETDEFVDYGAKRVHFEFGMHCLGNGGGRFIHYFKSTPELFAMAPDLERRFTDKALAVEECERLKTYEEALSYIYEKRASDAVRRALSLVMTKRAIAMFSRDQMSIRALKAATEKALTICPENEMARGTLRHTLIDLETRAVAKSLNRQKTGRASRIARGSKYPEVRDRYFEFVEIIYEDLMKSDFEQNEKWLILTDVYDWAATVDPRRPVIKKMQLFLNADK